MKESRKRIEFIQIRIQRNCYMSVWITVYETRQFSEQSMWFFKYDVNVFHIVTSLIINIFDDYLLLSEFVTSCFLIRRKTEICSLIISIYIGIPPTTAIISPILKSIPNNVNKGLQPVIMLPISKARKKRCVSLGPKVGKLNLLR